MQSTGWIFCLAPWLRRRGVEAVRAWMDRPRAVFNTNPYLAPVLLGARCRIEEDHSAELADRIEDTMQRTLGSLGDSVGWGAMRPLWFLATAVCGVALGPVAVLVAWVIFALGVVLVHQAGLQWGWRHGLAVVDRLGDLRLHALAAAGRRVAAMLSGAVAVGIVALTLTASREQLAWVALVVAVATGTVAVRLRRGSEWVLLIGMVAMILFAKWTGNFPEAVVTWR